MTRILGIDPGPQECGVCFLSGGVPGYPGVYPTVTVLRNLRPDTIYLTGVSVVVIEKLECYGMPVGESVFATAYVIGRMLQVLDDRGVPWVLMPRREVKLHLCGSVRAKDANVRQALIDRFGPVGTKKNPGKLYGVKSHAWSALALAVTQHETAELSLKATGIGESQ